MTEEAGPPGRGGERPPLGTHGWHLRVFLSQVGLLAVLASPTLLLDVRPPILFLFMLKSIFGLIALSLLIAGLLVQRRTPEPGFNVWDHCLAFVFLQLGCGIALRLIG